MAPKRSFNNEFKKILPKVMEIEVLAVVFKNLPQNSNFRGKFFKTPIEVLALVSNKT
jgi:hypothetical protein